MKENYLKIILLALIAVIAIQGYYIYDMNRQADSKQVSTKVHESWLAPKIKPFNGFLDEKTDPFLEMERLRREMEQSFMNFENFFQTTPSFEQFASRLHRIPRFDMKEQNDKYIITMELPGSSNQEIETVVKNGRLLVSAKVSEAKDDNTTTYHRHERYTSSFKRQIILPSDVDKASLDTQYKNGLLTITFSKKTS